MWSSPGRPRSIWNVVLPSLGAILYLGITPVNHSEAEDAYCYASDVETNRFNPQQTFHVLYVPVARTLHRLGLTRRAFPMMVILSKALGMASLLLLYAFLRRRLNRSRMVSTGTVLLLAFSYGYWRYSSEAEVYSLAIFMQTAFLYLLYRPVTIGTMISNGMMGGLVLMAHAFGIFPVTIVAFLRYAHVGRWRLFFPYMGTVILMSFAGYALLSPASLPTLTIQSIGTGQLSPATHAISVLSVAKSVIGMGQALIAGNFLFSYPAITTALMRAFPDRVLSEELFMGRHAGWLTQVVPPLTLTAIGLLGMLILLQCQRARPWHNLASKDNLPMLIWILLHGAFITWYEPANPEMWITVLVPVWILLGPAVMAARPRAIPWLLMAFLAIHNLVGGLLPILNRQGDYNRCKAAWLIQNTHHGDTIITLDNQVFSWYLSYHSSARVVNTYLAGQDSLDRISTMIIRGPGRVFATGDLFDIPPSYQATGSFHEQSVRFCNAHLDRFQCISERACGSVFLRGGGVLPVVFNDVGP